jgi:hypothetical protein
MSIFFVGLSACAEIKKGRKLNYYFCLNFVIYHWLYTFSLSPWDISSSIGFALRKNRARWMKWGRIGALCAFIESYMNERRRLGKFGPLHPQRVYTNTHLVCVQERGAGVYMFRVCLGEVEKIFQGKCRVRFSPSERPCAASLIHSFYSHTYYTFRARLPALAEEPLHSVRGFLGI